MEEQNAMINDNEMELIFDAISSNEGFARVAVAAFVSFLNPTLEEISDIKTAVSEAVTNAIIHGYENWGREKNSEKGKDTQIEGNKIGYGKVRVHCTIQADCLHIEVEDKGKGIEDIPKAMEPLFTTKPELNRSGMGFAFMEAFMDELKVESTVGEGTRVFMTKKLGTGSFLYRED